MADEINTDTTASTVIPGAFYGSLVRNNKEIKGARAASIFEASEISFRRYIEDLSIKLRELKRQRENMLDMAPNSAISLMLAENFDSNTFTKEYSKMGIDIRNLEVALEIGRKDYTYLFGGQ